MRFIIIELNNEKEVELSEINLSLKPSLGEFILYKESEREITKITHSGESIKIYVKPEHTKRKQIRTTPRTR